MYDIAHIPLNIPDGYKFVRVDYIIRPGEFYCTGSGRVKLMESPMSTFDSWWVIVKPIEYVHVRYKYLGNRACQKGEFYLDDCTGKMCLWLSASASLGEYSVFSQEAMEEI